MSSEEAPKLQAVNYANILAYLLNASVTYGVGVSGYFPTNAELSEKYQSLVTPAGYAFSIWGIIFLSQAAWTVLQALPAYRSSDVVVKGVGYYYVLACIAQSAWSFLFALEYIEGSVAAMLSILISLVLLVRKLSIVAVSTDTNSKSIWKWWAFKFPFMVHCGWIYAASLVNINVLLVSLELSAGLQKLASWISLGALLGVAMYYLIFAGENQKNYVIAVVLAWASAAIYVELQTPKEGIVNTFEVSTINWIGYAALGNSVIVLAAALWFGFQDWRTQQSSRDNDASGMDYDTMNNN